MSIDNKRYNKIMEQMKQLNVVDKITATKYLDLFKIAKSGFSKDYGVIPKSWLPVCIANGWVFEKQHEAKKILKLNYWDMTFEQASKSFRGIPKEIWKRGVLKHYGNS